MRASGAQQRPASAARDAAAEGFALCRFSKEEGVYRLRCFLCDVAGRRGRIIIVLQHTLNMLSIGDVASSARYALITIALPLRCRSVRPIAHFEQPQVTLPHYIEQARRD